ncbi:MAG: AAA family ATPase [Deltaproteobacteria bacterium]|nr:AAA family ATPase [Deltaproteobacteria bacterium]
MSESLQLLTTFVAPPIIRRYERKPDLPDRPHPEDYEGVVLFLDISGFTKMTEDLAKLGSEGTEQITRILNNNFDKLVDLVCVHGGEVVKFAGDAFAAVWLRQDELKDANSNAQMRQLVHLASQCALKIQRQTGKIGKGKKVKQDIFADRYKPSISFKIGIGKGKIQLAHVGGVNQRWDLLMKGQALERAVTAEGSAVPGDIVLEHGAHTIIEDLADGRDEVFGGFFLKKLTKKPALKELSPSTYNPEIEPALRLYIPDAVQDRVDAGQGDFIGELRRVTVLFINLPDIRSGATISQDQKIVQDVQEVVFGFEGAINKLSIDDKGVSVLAVFGLPPHSHEADPERGVRAALEIQQRFSPKNIKSSIGVTTGRAYCGAIGSSARREYTVIGDIVNLSARLMQAAKNSVLCDVSTYEASKGKLQYKELPKIKVKGKKDPVVIYRPVGSDNHNFSSTMDKLREFIVGRDNERAALAQAIEGLTLAKSSRVVIVQGEPGTGKSHLVQHAMFLAESKEIKTAIGMASSIERATPYLAFRGLFIDLLGLRTTTRRQSPREIIAKMLVDREDLAKVAPVLSDVLKIKLKDNEHTKKLDGKARVDRALEVMMHMMKVAAREQRYLIVLEDIHWFDSSSWELLVAMVQNVPGLLVLLTSRALPLPPPPGYLQVLRWKSTRTIRLTNLSVEDTAKLVSNRLQVDEIPQRISTLVYEHSHGNPFFIHEMALNLESAGIVEIDDGVCRIAERFQKGKIAVPNTIEGVVTSRIDSLTPAEQLTLKVASVIGREFQGKTLYDIFPVEREKERLKKHIEKLQSLGFLDVEGEGKNKKYIFQHVIIQEVSYQLMLHQQRSKLHQDVAAWYEESFRILDPYVGLLAHHYSNAGPTKAEEAFDYIDKAGEAALQAGAAREATEFYLGALELFEKLDDSAKPKETWRKASWQRHLSDAFFAMGNRKDSVIYANDALESIGSTQPKSILGWKALTLKSLLVFHFRRLFPLDFFWVKSKETGRVLTEFSYAARRLAELYYLEYRELPMLGISLLAVNKGNRVRNFSGAPYSYAMLGQIYGIRGRHRQATRYFKLSRAMAEKLNRPGAMIFSSNAHIGYLAGTGALAPLTDMVSDSVDLSEIYGDRQDAETSWVLKSHVQYFSGQMESSIETAQLAIDSARERGNRQNEAQAEIAKARALIATGNFVVAVDSLNRVKSNLRGLSDVASELVCFGLLGLALIRLGKLGEARVEAMECLARCKSCEAVAFSTLHGYEAVAEVCLVLWQEARKQKSRYTKSLAEHAQHALSYLENFTSRFPVGRPSLILLKARRAIVSDDIRKAGKFLDLAMTESRRVKIPYIEAQVVFELSRFAGTPPHLRNHYRTTAQDLFWRMRSQYFIDELAAAAKASRE